MDTHHEEDGYQVDEDRDGDDDDVEEESLVTDDGKACLSENDW